MAGDGRTSFDGKIHNFWDVSVLLWLLSLFTALSRKFKAVFFFFFCKVVPRPAEARAGAIAELHQLEFTIRWQSTNAFLRCGLLVAGEGCVSGPLVSELAGPCCSGADYRGLPEDFLKVAYHLDHITMTFSGTNLILGANPGYQAFHRSFRSNTVRVLTLISELTP